MSQHIHLLYSYRANHLHIDIYTLWCSFVRSKKVSKTVKQEVIDDLFTRRQKSFRYQETTARRAVRRYSPEWVLLKFQKTHRKVQAFIPEF